MKKELVLLSREKNDRYRTTKITKEAESAGYTVHNIDFIEMPWHEIYEKLTMICKAGKPIFFFVGGNYFCHIIIELFEGKAHMPQARRWQLSDKYSSYIFFKENNIATPKTTLLLRDEPIKKSIEHIGGYPCILKKTTGSGGSAVHFIRSEEDLYATSRDYIEETKERPLAARESVFILQEPITESFGTDYRVLCIENQILGIVRRTSQSSFKSNFSLGGNIVHITSDPELEKIAKEIMRKSGLFFAGLDFIKTESGYMAIETNTSPQYEGFEQATGINVSREVVGELAKQY